jgi:predicted nucleic acid-binding protein
MCPADFPTTREFPLGIIFIQVLQELYVTLTRKVAKPLTEQAAKAVIEDYLAWRVVSNTEALLREAIHISRRHKLS